MREWSPAPEVGRGHLRRRLRRQRSVALPILREERVPATFFIATSYLDGGRMWNDTVIEAVRRLPAGDIVRPRGPYDHQRAPQP